ncbi:hypothetical protein [Nonomuraea sp. NPDC049400]|uniref:hypothetical protein n=1 Tax=Nonomuraea sp. NPDC049400 TaxID=3364352 RepID=UPI0037AE45AA
MDLPVGVPGQDLRLGVRHPGQPRLDLRRQPHDGFLKGTGENALGGFFSSPAGQAWVDHSIVLVGLARANAGATVRPLLRN